jgi:hypothetical protein
MFGRNLFAAFPQVRHGHSGSTKYYLGIDLLDINERGHRRRYRPPTNEDDVEGHHDVSDQDH